MKSLLYTPWMPEAKTEAILRLLLLAAETDEPMMRPDMYLELGAGGQWSVMKPGTLWTGQRLECRAGHSDASHPVSTRCITTL